MLEQRSQTPNEADKLAQMAQAANDLLFMVDLQETMSAFAEVDAEWWEPTQAGMEQVRKLPRGPLPHRWPFPRP
jgi:hypothetical protein